MQVLFDLAIEGYLYSQPDSARYFGEQLLTMAENANNAEFEADAYALIGSSFFVTGKFQKAITSFKKYEIVATINGLENRTIKAKMNIGTALLQIGAFEEALEILYESLELQREMGDSLGVAKCMNNIGLAFMNMNQFVKALEYFKAGLPVFEEAGMRQLITYSQGNIATIYTYQGKTDSAYLQLQQILSIHQEMNDVHGMITAHNSLSEILLKQGKLSEALEQHRESARMSNKMGDVDGIALAKGKISDTYFHVNELDSALKYRLEVLSIRREMNDLSGIAISLHRLGDITHKLGNTAQALNYYQESRSLRTSTGDEPGVSDALVAEAGINMENGEYDTAMNQLNEALSIQKKYTDSLRLTSTLINLGTLHFKILNYSQARAHATAAIELAGQFGSLNHQRNAYKLNYEVLKAYGLSKQALTAYEHYILLRDSVNNDENRKTLMRYQLQFEFEKKALQLAKEQAEKDATAAIEIEKQQQTINTLTGGGMFLIVCGLAGFLIYRQRERNKYLSSSITARDYERNRLSRELHDGVANELFGIQMAIENDQYVSDHSQLYEQLSNIRNDVRMISHDLAMPDISHTTLPEMARYLVNRWIDADRKVEVTIAPMDNDFCQLKPEKAIHLYRILQEGLSNALKYSADYPVHAKLEMRSNTIILEISNHYDPGTSQKSTGIGLKNLQERTQLLGGLLNIEMHNGLARLLVKIPVYRL